MNKPPVQEVKIHSSRETNAGEVIGSVVMIGMFPPQNPLIPNCKVVRRTPAQVPNTAPQSR